MTYTVGATFKIYKGLSFNANYSFKYNTVDYMERTENPSSHNIPEFLRMPMVHCLKISCVS